MTNIYIFQDYKAYLFNIINENKSVRGFQGKLAEAAQCNPSYLSQILKGKYDITLDQAILISSYIGLDQLSTEYFLFLVQHAKANTSQLKKYLEHKMSELKKESQSLTAHIGNERPQVEIESRYYSSWHYIALHILTSCENYQTIENLEKRVHISRSRMLAILNDLKNMGLIDYHSGRWVYKAGAFNLPTEAVMNEVHHTHWRQRALHDVQQMLEKSIHYSSVFSMSKTDYLQLKNDVILFIEKSRKQIEPSAAEETYAFCLDLFLV